MLAQVAMGQQIAGKVLNRKTNEPIAYVNIGIVGTPYGTISDPDGSFQLTVPASHESDSIIFSALGFTRVRFTFASFGAQPKTVLLDEVSTQLREIIISKNPPRRFELGNDAFNGGVLETDTAYAGAATALLINPGLNATKKGFSFPAYVDKAKLRIMKNNLAVMKFRVRLNEVSPNGTPGRDLLQESIVVASEARRGWLEFDLASTAVVVDKPFFVTFEQILDRTDRASIASGFHAFMIEHPDKLRTDTVVVNGQKEVRQMIGAIGLDLPGTFVSISRKEKVSDRSVSYQRDTSFSEWKKVNGIITAVVIVRPITN